MVFPKPISEKYFDGYLEIADFDIEKSLLDFYKKSDDLGIMFYLNEFLDEEEYKLTIDSEKIRIEHSTETGKFRGVTSLRHIFLKSGRRLPFCEIHDKPDFERRGYMLDISRHRIPKLDTILEFVDLLADLKYNELQLYMDSFCFKYSAFSEYFENIDCLTVEDIQFLDGYCRERFIDLVPNQNSFGHMKAWVDRPEHRHLALGYETKVSETLNPILDETVEFMDNVYGSLLPHFKSKYVNIGLDEAFGLGKFQTEKDCKEKGKDTVFIEYLTKLNNLINKKYDKSVQFWADMIIKYPESFDKFPQNVTAIEWGYDMLTTLRMENRCRLLNERGVRFYVAPGTNAWNSLTSRTALMEYNVRCAAEAGKKYGAVGLLMTDWGSNKEGHMQFLVHSYLPCALAAQYSWNTGAEQNGEMFKNDFRFAAMEYLDKFVYRGEGIGELMYKLGRYYQLEPHTTHDISMTASALVVPMSQRYIADGDILVYDLDKVDASFYFENIIEYLTKIIDSIRSSTFDARLKEEILINAEMLLIGAELSLIKSNRFVTEEKRKELIGRIDCVIDKYTTLWEFRNHIEGLNVSLNNLLERKKELSTYGYELVRIKH